MASQIQTFWDSMPVELHAPSNNAAAALAINAWDNIGRGIGNLGTKLIEEPMSKLYRADLNAGRDISGYDPLALTNKVLEDTPTVRGQLLENDTKAFDLGIKRANEADMVKYSPQLNEARRLANAGKIKEAQAVISSIPTDIRASVLKEFLPNVDDSLRDQQKIGIEAAKLNALIKGQERKWAMEDKLMDLAEKSKYYRTLNSTHDRSVLDVLKANRGRSKEELRPILANALMELDPYRTGKASINKTLDNLDLNSLYDSMDAFTQLQDLLSINNNQMLMESNPTLDYKAGNVGDNLNPGSPNTSPAINIQYGIPRK